MKKLKFVSILMIQAVVSLVSFAQDGLEYPGGPSAKVTQADIDRLKNWSRNVQLDLSRLTNKIATLTHQDEIRDLLYNKIKYIAGSTGLTQTDLLLRQSLYSGVILSDIIRQEGIRKEPTPGLVQQEISILKKSIQMASKYYQSDYTYLDGLLSANNKTHFNNRLVEFGVELTQFSYEQCTRVLALDASAAYGILNWSLRVLNKKLLEDERNVVFASTIEYLAGTEALGMLNLDGSAYFPDMNLLKSDVEAIIKIGKLKFLAKQTFSEIKLVLQSLN